MSENPDDVNGSATVDDRLHFVATEAAFMESDRVLVDVKEREFVVFRVDNDYHATLNYCPHQGGPVGEGLLTGRFGTDIDGELTLEDEGEVIACPWHGWEFSVTSGECFSDDTCRLPSYDVVVQDADVFLVV